MRDIADTGLNCAFPLLLCCENRLNQLKVCLEVVNNFAGAADPAVGNAFFQQYFLSIVQDVFFVLTDTDHKSGFKLQSVLLARMFQLVELNMIHTPLFDPSQPSNAVFLRDYCANLLKSAFPHVQPYVLVYPMYAAF